MGFGKRVRLGLRNGLEPAGDRTERRRLAATMAAGLILGFGGVTAGTGLVQASEQGGVFDFFGALFGAPQRQVVVYPAPAPRRRFASLPDARHVTAPRQRSYTPRTVPLVDLNPRPRRGDRKHKVLAAAVPATGPLSVCVRTCDGYMFPLGLRRSQGDIPLHRAACASACPDAQTQLYTLPWGKTELDQTVSLKGQPYLAAAWANVYKTKSVENCHCRNPGSTAAPLSIDHDPTIREGDVVATKTSAAVVTRLSGGAVTTEDYRTSRRLTRSGRRIVELRVGALRREAAEKSFRRTMRLVSAGEKRIRVAEAGAAHGPIVAAGGDLVGEAGLKTSFAPVRVLVPSPFVY